MLVRAPRGQDEEIDYLRNALQCIELHGGKILY